MTGKPPGLEGEEASGPRPPGPGLAPRSAVLDALQCSCAGQLVPEHAGLFR